MVEKAGFELPPDDVNELDKLNIIEKARHALSPAKFAIWLSTFTENERGSRKKNLTDEEQKNVQIKAGDRKQAKA